MKAPKHQQDSNNAAYESDEVQEDIRRDATKAGDGDREEADERLVIVRQPKQSDADLVTAELSTVRS